MSGSVVHEQRDWALNSTIPRDQTGFGLMLEPVIEGEEKYEGYALNDLADEDKCFSPGRPMKKFREQKTETFKDGSEKDGYDHLVLIITRPEPSEQSKGDLPAFRAETKSNQFTGNRLGSNSDARVIMLGHSFSGNNSNANGLGYGVT
jgi:hypothetical protein